jgi:ABC-type transporter Mla subunit MlaD
MSHTLTAGLWRANALRGCGCDWPFNWTCEITAFDPVTRSHHYIATIHQSGARRMDEAAANARAMTEACAMAQVMRRLGMILDQSDPDHEAFVDSAADCLDGLLAQQEEIRRILAALDGVAVKTAPRLRIAHELCHHD